MGEATLPYWNISNKKLKKWQVFVSSPKEMGKGINRASGDWMQVISYGRRGRDEEGKHA
jgi:hypothetical protein